MKVLSGQDTIAFSQMVLNARRCTGSLSKISKLTFVLRSVFVHVIWRCLSVNPLRWGAGRGGGGIVKTVFGAFFATGVDWYRTVIIPK